MKWSWPKCYAKRQSLLPEKNNSSGLHSHVVLKYVIRCQLYFYVQIIPQQLCYNAGLDATDILNQLRHAHAKGDKWAGVNIHKEEVGDNLAAYIWEPSLVKKVCIAIMQSNLLHYRMPLRLQRKLFVLFCPLTRR